MKRLLYLALLVAYLPLAANAQSVISYAEKHGLDPDDVRWQLIEEQLVRSLAHPNQAVVLQSLENTILLTITHRDQMDVNRLSKAVTRVHKRAKNQEIKDAALAALLIAGSNEGLMYARAVAKPDKDRSRTLAFNVIDNHFAKKHMLVARPIAQ